MPAFLNMSSVMQCPHGGTVQPTTSNTKVKAAGDYVLRASDTFVIAGCPFILALVPHPCTQVQWLAPAAKNQAMGDFVLTEQSLGLCVAGDKAVQGMVIVASTQPKVAGM